MDVLTLARHRGEALAIPCERYGHIVSRFPGVTFITVMGTFFKAETRLSLIVRPLAEARATVSNRLVAK